jgi:hypothetical protein
MMQSLLTLARLTTEERARAESAADRRARIFRLPASRRQPQTGEGR